MPRKVATPSRAPSERKRCVCRGGWRLTNRCSASAVSGPRMSAGSRRLRATARLTRRHAVPFPAARALQAFTLGQPLGAATGPTPPGGAGGASSALPEARAEDQSLNRIVSSSVEAGAAAAAVQGAGARLPGLPAAAPRVSEGAGADTRTASSEGGAAPDRRMSPLASAVLSLMQVRAAALVLIGAQSGATSELWVKLRHASLVALDGGEPASERGSQANWLGAIVLGGLISRDV